MRTTNGRLPATLPKIGVVIDPQSVFSLDQAQQLLGLRQNTLRREARLRRLRVLKRGGRLFTTGEWLWAWLAAGEVKRGGPSSQ